MGKDNDKFIKGLERWLQEPKDAKPVSPEDALHVASQIAETARLARARSVLEKKAHEKTPS